MAFVFKSKKEGSKPIGETNSIGPGEYLPQTELRQIRINKEPFLIGAKRTKTKVSEVPGPGAYYHDDTLINYLKNVQNEKIQEQNDREQLIALKDGQLKMKPNLEKLGFITREKRFKLVAPNETPGPGFYFPSIKPKIKSKGNASPSKQLNQTYAQEMKKMKKVISIKKADAIPSIPCMNQDFGFDITKNGELCKIENPEMYRTFSGEKGDTVGPGSYEVDHPEMWHKTGTEWSKFRTKRNDPFGQSPSVSDSESKFYKTNFAFGKKANDPILSLQTTKYSENAGFLMSSTTYGKFGESGMSVRNNNNNNTTVVVEANNRSKEKAGGADNEHVKKENKNSLNCRIINVKNANNRIVKEQEKNLEKLIQKNQPGPGYYYDDKKTTSFNKQPYPEFKQFFGSKIERFKNNNNSIDDNQVSPATYFQDNSDTFNVLIKQEKLSRTAKNFAPFESRTNRFFKPQPKLIVPGPGQYDPPSQFEAYHNKSAEHSTKGGAKQFSKTFSKFGSTSKRFSENSSTKWQYETPGPGSYINPYNMNKNEGVVNYRDMIIHMEKAKSLSKTHYNNNEDNNSRMINPLLNRKMKVPPVGLYNPERIFTIDYNNQRKKLKRPYPKDVAFSSGMSKSINKGEYSNLGPGYYYKEKKIDNKQVYPPFRQGDKKWKNNYVGEYLTGPGQYNMDSYFGWNRKTFNINFV